MICVGVSEKGKNSQQTKQLVRQSALKTMVELDKLDEISIEKDDLEEIAHRYNVLFLEVDEEFSATKISQVRTENAQAHFIMMCHDRVNPFAFTPIHLPLTSIASNHLLQRSMYNAADSP